MKGISLKAINWLFTYRAINHGLNFQRLGDQAHPKVTSRSILQVMSAFERWCDVMERILDLELEDLSPSPSSAQVSMTLGKYLIVPGLSLLICKMGTITPFLIELL